MALKVAFLGCWHSHTGMHLREAARSPDEVQFIGMYDPDPEVIAIRQGKSEEEGLDIPVFDSVDAVLNSEVDAVIVEGHVLSEFGLCRTSTHRRQACVAGKARGC